MTGDGPPAPSLITAIIHLCGVRWRLPCLSSSDIPPHSMTDHCTSCAAEQVLELLQCAQQQPHVCRSGCADLSVGKGHLHTGYCAKVFMFPILWSHSASVLMHRRMLCASTLPSGSSGILTCPPMTGVWILGVLYISRVCAAAFSHGIHDIHPLNHSFAPQQDLHAVSSSCKMVPSDYVCLEAVTGDIQCRGCTDQSCRPAR